MKLYLHEIENQFDYKTLQRGYEYYAKEMINGYEVVEEDRELVVLSSNVKGRYYREYDQNIMLDKRSQKLSIRGSCSCPVGYNCKHIVAVCLAYIKDIKNNNPTKDVDLWLDSVKRIARPEVLVSDYFNNGNFLIYRLFENEDNYYRQEIKFYKSKYNKSGKISKGTLLSSDSLLFSASYIDIIDRDDREVINLCKALYPKNSYETNTLSGSLGYMIIMALIRTSRCFYKNSNVPIVFSDEVIKIEMQWEEFDDGYRLVSTLEEYYHIVPTEPILVIDTISNRVSVLDIQIEAYILKELLSSPIIPKNYINKVYEELSLTLKDTALPVPEGYVVHRIEEKPIPLLRLFYKNNEYSKFHAMKLDFIYGKEDICYYPKDKIVSFFKNSKKIEIIRDLEIEDQAINRLKKLGFSVEIYNKSLYFKSYAKPDMQRALRRWSNFLQTDMDKLKDDGWNIQIDNSFNMRFDDISDISVESESGNDWFSLSFDFEFAGEKRELVPLVSSLIEQYNSFESLPESINIELEDEHFLKIKKDEIAPILKTIFELYDSKNGDSKIKVSTFESHFLSDGIDESVIWKGDREVLELSKKLKNFEGIKKVEPPKCLEATLREYQKEGLNWLNFLYKFQFNGILADDMGLGKTIQTLSHLSRLKENGLLKVPSLIIMPTSLIANWKNEISKFTPNLTYLSLHGSDRAERFKDILKHDIVLTTYALIVRDFEIFKDIDFFYVILDEAQKIKNPKTKMAISIKNLKSSHRLALSGTPIENHLGELWSIFSFLMPGFLDTQSFFKKYYQNPIEKEHDMYRQELLNRRVKPFMLRRTKEKVASELPEKLEIIKYTQFEKKQAKLYESIRITMEKKVRDAISSKGLNRSHITILDALLKLRQVCCDPSLLKVDEAKKINESAKLELFLELVDELLTEGRKILVFSQFTSMLSIIEENLKKKGINYTKLTGSTKNREEVIETFRNGDAKLFLISLKAGGVGLNLVEADTVIHYDPWWNPAVENQATDRVHRIGQRKKVFVYKLIVENTIEQKILELQKKKQELFNSVYDGESKDSTKFTGEELIELLK